MAAALARWAGPALLQLRPAVSVTGGSRALSSFQPEAPGLVSNLEAKAVQELRRLMEDQAAKPAAAGEAEGGAQQSAELESEAASEERGGNGEVGGPKGKEPTRFGDWERNGRCTDF
mmetsp:Transcript_37124/g.94868  ORF Transcript_37124/g.94868 Transcript_37124/m.94868 type:complete len:117 (-) Transcript_37124:232-582(-)|eukprot:jgi/Tetstr1/445617/TSEL_003422.t1